MLYIQTGSPNGLIHVTEFRGRRKMVAGRLGRKNDETFAVVIYTPVRFIHLLETKRRDDLHEREVCTPMALPQYQRPSVLRDLVQNRIAALKDIAEPSCQSCQLQPQPHIPRSAQQAPE